MRPGRTLCGFGLAVLAIAALPAPAEGSGGPTLSISVLSGRADLVSGDDALIQIRVPDGAGAGHVEVTVDPRRGEKRNVTGAFRRDGERLVGLVKRLDLGRNVVVPTDPCAGTTVAERYHPLTNPAGVRCSIVDAAINVFGPHPAARGGRRSEQAARPRLQRTPADHVGVQYGLERAAQQQDHRRSVRRPEREDRPHRHRRPTRPPTADHGPVHRRCPTPTAAA